MVKDWLSGLRPKDQTSVGVSFVAGSISGTPSFDVVKTQRLGEVEAVRLNLLLLRRIWAESRMRGLFAGPLPRPPPSVPS